MLDRNLSCFGGLFGVDKNDVRLFGICFGLGLIC